MLQMERIGIYPGSFDPPTLGHVDLIERASGLVDRLIVGIGINSQKTPFLDIETRTQALRECTAHLPNVEVEAFTGLLVNWAETKNCRILIRGLRAVSDYDSEFRIAMANRSMAPDIETVFLIARDTYSFLSSSVVREAATLGGNYSQFVPEPVYHRIEKALGRTD
jgi:pantetheine-phosphate adenylyltransferase